MSFCFRVQAPRLSRCPVTWVASVEAVWWVVQTLLTFEEMGSLGTHRCSHHLSQSEARFFLSKLSLQGDFSSFSQPPTHPPVWNAFLPQHGPGGVGVCCLKAHPSFSKQHFSSIFRNGTQDWFLGGSLDPSGVMLRPPNLQSFRITHLT